MNGVEELGKYVGMAKENHFGEVELMLYNEVVQLFNRHPVEGDIDRFHYSHLKRINAIDDYNKERANLLDKIKRLDEKQNGN